MALDLVWLLHKLNKAFDQGVSPSHLVPVTDRSPPSVLGNANRHATATWMASSENLKPLAFTLLTQPPPIPPPPLSQKHPPFSQKDHGWKVIQPQLSALDKYAPSHAEFIGYVLAWCSCAATSLSSSTWYKLFRPYCPYFSFK